MNFAEQLAYWYLRLNGFVPMTNFVLHYDEHNTRPVSDADIIAVRFPHVFEATGGQKDDWDNVKFKKWGITTERTLAFIVEVKSGRWNARELSQRHWRIAAGIKRIGVVGPAVADSLADQLENMPKIDHGEFTIAKLLVTPACTQNVPWLGLTLDEAVNFIQGRMAKYRERKMNDRMNFDGDLIQFFAWRAGQALRSL